MTTSTQTIFSRAVQHHLQDAFVSILDRIDEFDIGTVLIYNEKPHFWRKTELNFSGVQLADVLEESQKAEFKFNTESKPLFDETSDSSQRTVNIDLDLDGDMKIAFIDVGGNIGVDAKKVVKLTVSLGSFKHNISNMYDSITAKSFTVDINHPIIREAINKGKTLFVISSVYQSQKVEITVSREADIGANAKENEGGSTDTPKATPGASDTTTKPESGLEKAVDETETVVQDLASKGLTIPKEDLTADAKSVTTGLSGYTPFGGVYVNLDTEGEARVTKREVPSNIGFSVLRMDIGKNGVLIPQAKIGVPYHHKIHSSFADAFDHIDSSANATGKPSTDTKPSTDATVKPSTDATVKPSTDATGKPSTDTIGKPSTEPRSSETTKVAADKGSDATTD